MKHGAFLLILLCGLALLPGLDRQVMERQQELRVTLTARDMVQTGRWLIPHFQNELRLKKPPLMYWVVAGAFRVFGTDQSVFVARLPNVFSTMSLLAAIYWAGLTLTGDHRKALLAVVLAASAFIVQRYARVAETDIAQALFVTLSCTASFRALAGDKPARWWVLAGLFSGLGFMIKGPAAIVLPLLAVAVYLVSRRISGRPSGLRWSFLWMLPVFALLALPWYAALEMMPATDALSEAAVGSEMQALIEHDGDGHPAPIYYYIQRTPVSFLPWGLLLFPAIWMLWKNRKQREGNLFVLGWITSTLVLLSALYNKQPHYILLLLPSSAIMTAALIMPWMDGQPGRMNGFVGGFFVFLLAIASALPVAAVVAPLILDWLPRTPMMVAGAAFAAIAACGWFLLLKKKRFGVMLSVWAVMAAIVYMYIFILHPFHRPETIIPEFAREARGTLGDIEKVYFIGRKRACVEFYANRTMVPITDGDAKIFWPKMEPGTALVTVVKIKASDVSDTGGPPPVLELVRKEIRCRLYVKPPRDA